MRFWAFFIVSALVFAPSAVARLRCITLLESAVLTEPAFRSPGFFTAYSVADFFPKEFIVGLRKRGLEPKLEISFDQATRRGTFQASTQSGIFARFDFWPGTAADSVVVEDLRLENPLAPVENLHSSQNAKGLPGNVALEFRNRLYRFFAAGGFKTLEVARPQNFLVGALYRRFLRGTQSSAGETFSAYLAKLYEASSKRFPEEFRIRNIDQFSEAMGGFAYEPLRTRIFGGDAVIALEELKTYAKFYDDVKILVDPPSEVPLAVTFGRQVVFLYREGEGFRPLFWREIYRRHPDWIRVDVALPVP